MGMGIDRFTVVQLDNRGGGERNELVWLDKGGKVIAEGGKGRSG